jgi:hypothetical protein
MSEAKSQLLALTLHGDVIPIVLEYASTIHLQMVRCFGRKGTGDGEFRRPHGLAVQGDELFVCDSVNQRVQVFHCTNGRFLRSFGDWASRCKPIAISTNTSMVCVADSSLTVRTFSIHDFSALKSIQCAENVFDVFCLGETLMVMSVPTLNQLLWMHLETQKIKKMQTKLERPRGLYVDGEDIFVVSRGNVQVLNARHPMCYKTGLDNGPDTVVVHGEQVIVASSIDQRLQIFNRDSQQLEKTLPFMHKPCSMALYKKTQELFVSDCDGHKIVVFQ